MNSRYRQPTETITAFIYELRSLTNNCYWYGKSVTPQLHADSGRENATRVLVEKQDISRKYVRKRHSSNHPSPKEIDQSNA